MGLKEALLCVYAVVFWLFIYQGMGGSTLAFLCLSVLCGKYQVCGLWIVDA